MKLHPTGQGYVRHQGKCVYFGKYGTPEAKRKYEAWLQHHGCKNMLTIGQLFAQYGEHYPKAQADKMRVVIAALGSLAAMKPEEFSVLAFRKMRDRLNTGSRCARHINDLMRLVQRIFRYGVSLGYCPLATWEALKTVQPLRADESSKTSTIRMPVSRSVVLQTIQHLHEPCASIIKLLLLTGGRPSEICGLKASEIDKQGPHGTWVIRPSKHKTSYHGKRRFLIAGKECQAVLQACWPAVGDYFFPSRLTTGHYAAHSLKQAVERTTKLHGLPYWTPYQIRHLFLSEIATNHGEEAAALIAGHASLVHAYVHGPSAEEVKRAI